MYPYSEKGIKPDSTRDPQRSRASGLCQLSQLVLRHNVPDENDRHHSASVSGYHCRLTLALRQRHQLARFLVKEGVHQLHVITFDAAIKTWQPQTRTAREASVFCVKLPVRDQ